MTLSSEIIKRGSIECGQCRGVPAIRKVMPDGEVLPCVCGDPEFNVNAVLATARDVEFMDHMIFGELQKKDLG